MFRATIFRSTDPRFQVGTVLCTTDTLHEADDLHDDFMERNNEPDIDVRFEEIESCVECRRMSHDEERTNCPICGGTKETLENIVLPRRDVAE